MKMVYSSRFGAGGLWEDDCETREPCAAARLILVHDRKAIMRTHSIALMFFRAYSQKMLFGVDNRKIVLHVYRELHIYV